MKTKQIAYTDHFAAVMEAMTARGLLLAAHDPKGKANAMAIGWGTIGSIWGLPMWVVLVRPSRYTYQCLEHSGCFSVNVPGPDLKGACDICGSKSGRDGDKLAEAKLTVEQGPATGAPILTQCPIIYECRVVHHNDVIPAELAEEIKTGCYPKGDFHRIYFGKIIAAGAADNAAKLLGR